VAHPSPALLVPAILLSILAVLALGSALVVLRRRLVIVRVDGTSMRPALEPGDRVLVRRCRLDQVRRGQVVVVQRPDERAGWGEHAPVDRRLDGRGWYIKRAAAVPGDPLPAVVRGAVGTAEATVPTGKLVVLGDASRSDDSRRWGYVPADRVLGVVARPLTRGRSSGRSRTAR
jgi:signal peptidase I